MPRFHLVTLFPEFFESPLSTALMTRLEKRWPGYGFEAHKGYGTEDHYEALRRLGPCPQHRLTFRGVLPEKPSPQQGSLL